MSASPTSCHSLAISSTGVAYGWGRNETGQLGLGSTSAVVPLPTKLTVPEDGVKFVGGGVGKYHTVLVGSNGIAYASGGNLCGQLGINNQGCQGVDKFRKCSVVGQITGGEDDEDGEGKGGSVKIVRVSHVAAKAMRYWVFCLGPPRLLWRGKPRWSRIEMERKQSTVFDSSLAKQRANGKLRETQSSERTRGVGLAETDPHFHGPLLGRLPLAKVKGKMGATLSD